MVESGPNPETEVPPQEENAHFSASGIARSVFSNWFGMAANLLVAFFMSPFVVYRLGNTAYGIWTLVLQLTGYMGVVDVGLRSALIRFISRFHSQKDDDSLNALFSTTMVLYSGLAAACFGLGCLMAAFALPYLHIPRDMMGESRITLVVASLILGTDFIFATYQAALGGLSRWDLRNGVAVGVMLLRTVLSVIALLMGYGLVSLAVIQLGSSMIGHGFEVALVRRLLPNLKIALSNWRRSILGPVISHSGNSFLISVGQTINYGVDSVVIAVFLPVAQVTLYAIGMRLVQQLRIVINGTALIVAPLASELDAKGRHDEVGQLLIRGTKYTLLMGFLGTVALLCIGPDFIRVWMGVEFGPSSGLILRIMAASQFVALTEMMATHLLYGLGKHRINVYCTLAEAVINLGASILLAKRYGIYGVAAGTTVASVLVKGTVFPMLFLRVLKVDWRDYLRFAILPNILPTLGFAVGSLAMHDLVPIHNWPTFFLSTAAGLALFLPAAWFSAIDESERERLRGFVRRFLARRRAAATPAD
jgi:O-antigen/teichoic acid export membrane protein